ncbi:hypothetical protein ACQJBY_006480 [Aegilops geniculata]
MVARLMTVIDPLYTKKCPSPPTQQRDEIIAWKVHHAILHCLTEYYTRWPTSKDCWTVKFLALADTKFIRDETGACVVHIVRQSDGEKLKLPISKHNIAKSKREAIHVCMKLQGNFSSLARDALWHVLAPSDSAFVTG